MPGLSSRGDIYSDIMHAKTSLRMLIISKWINVVDSMELYSFSIYENFSLIEQVTIKHRIQVGRQQGH
jgi:hypothetical protein